MRSIPALIAGVWVAASAGAQTYTFTRVAGPQNQFISVGDGPSINDAGDIAFQAGLSSGGTAILRVTPGGVITTIASTATWPFVTLDPRPSIDRLGNVVVFGGTLSNGAGAFAGNGGPITTIAAPPEFASIFGSPVALPGSNGAAVFAGIGQRDGEGVYRGHGGAPELLAGSPQGLSGFGNNIGANASGAVAFRGVLAGIGQGVYLRAGGVTTPLATVAAGFVGFAGTVALNANNRAAFRAAFVNGTIAIIVADPNGWIALADSSGPFFTFNVPAINDAGEVVFRATTDSLSAGIFRGPDPVADRIIGTGDAFDGSTIASLDLHSLAINNRGQIAFRAVLADGRQEIVRADPPPCPADIIVDRVVNVNDLLAVITSWGPCSQRPQCPADIAPTGGDDRVDVNDLLAVITSWGRCR